MKLTTFRAPSVAGATMGKLYVDGAYAGNRAEDTEGCLLLGMQATEATLIGGTSRPAVEMVRGDVRAAIERGEEVWIDINNPVGVA